MRVKLVALDMDGTLLDSAKRLPPDFMDWVKLLYGKRSSEFENYCKIYCRFE